MKRDNICSTLPLAQSSTLIQSWAGNKYQCCQEKGMYIHSSFRGWLQSFKMRHHLIRTSPFSPRLVFVFRGAAKCSLHHVHTIRSRVLVLYVSEVSTFLCRVRCMYVHIVTLYVVCICFIYFLSGGWRVLNFEERCMNGGQGGVLRVPINAKVARPNVWYEEI